jgi:hypothetical protein
MALSSAKEAKRVWGCLGMSAVLCTGGVPGSPPLGTPVSKGKQEEKVVP